MTVRLFDGGDVDVLAGARADWKNVAASGATAVFWAKEGGRWVEKARSGASD
jgi:DNA polymerase-3 subunit chi